MHPLPALRAAVLLAIVHLFAWRLEFLNGKPRNRWLPLAGGVAVGYFTDIPRLYHGLFLAVTSGGIVFTAIKEELPVERESSILPFFAALVLSAVAMSFAAEQVK